MAKINQFQGISNSDMQTQASKSIAKKCLIIGAAVLLIIVGPLAINAFGHYRLNRILNSVLSGYEYKLSGNNWTRDQTVDCYGAVEPRQAIKNGSSDNFCTAAANANINTDDQSSDGFTNIKSFYEKLAADNWNERPSDLSGV